MFEQTQQDLKNFHTMMSDFWKRIPDDAWDKKTGSRDKDWTLHELLAHILSISQMFNKAANAAIRNEDIVINDFTERGQIGDWNDEQIARLILSPPNGLIVQLLQELRISHDIVGKINEDNVAQMSQLANFNRPARAIDYVHWQLSHAAIIHGAQAIVPLNQEPLWTKFDSELTQRVTGYYLQQWSMAYWQDLGPDEAQAINFHVNGDGGGDWNIIIAPDGGSSDSGSIDGGNYDLFFESPHVFFSVFTNHISIREAMVNGKMRLASDVRDTLGVLRLFSPKRPNMD